MNILKAETVKSCLKMLMDRNGVIPMMNLPREDMDFIQTSAFWVAMDRARATKILNTFIYGIQDMQGIGRIEPPVEYIAAVIIAVVKPINFMAACDFVGSAHNAEMITSPTTTEQREITGSMIHANICEMYGECGDYVCKKMEHKVKTAKKMEVEQNAK